MDFQLLKSNCILFYLYATNFALIEMIVLNHK